VAAGVRSPSATKWQAATVYNLLRSAVYKGRWTYNRQARGNWVRHESPDLKWREEADYAVCENAHEALVDPSLFDRIQIQMQTKGRNQRRTTWKDSSYLLRGLIRKHSCACPYYGHIRKCGGKGYRYYEDKCQFDRMLTGCTRSAIPQQVIEQFVLDEVCRRIIPSVRIGRLRQLVGRQLREQDTRQREETGLRTRILKTEKKLRTSFGPSREASTRRW